MPAHYLCTALGLKTQNIYAKTIDVGGASPISCLIEAKEMIIRGKAKAVLVTGGDTVASLNSENFSNLSSGFSTSWVKDKSENILEKQEKLPSIHSLYDAVAQWSMHYYGTKREQLAMVPVLMSKQGINHPESLISQKRKTPYTLEEVLESKNISKVTNLLECARRSDGAVSIIVVSEEYVKKYGLQDRAIPILGGGEASTSLTDSLSNYKDEWDNSYFSCERAANIAYKEAGLTVKDIGYFGLYDCYPVCFIEALEGVGLCDNGEGARFVEDMYRNYTEYNPSKFPINTHGGLLSFGAPWEVPAFYLIVECILQLRKEAQNRQVFPYPKYSLVYSNGGVFSASAVAILGSPEK